MPKLPTNMVRRKGRPGYHFRKKSAGKTKWVALGVNYEEACAKLRKMKREEVRFLPELRVKDAAQQWLKSYVPIARQPAGQKLALYRIARYFDPCFGHLLLSRVTKEHLRSFRLYLEKQRIQPRTVQHVLSDARCFFNWCEDAGLIDRSPFPRRIMPRVQERPPDRLTDEEADMLRVLPEPHGFVCRLGLGTGLRWGELSRAQASDLERGFLVVHHTKSGRVRRVPLPPELLAEVRMRMGRLVPYARVSPGSFARVVRRATGIAGFHAHQMRHTFACQWLERGGSLAALQQILGHASIETTQRYARLTDEVVMREAERLAGQGVAKGVASFS
jgi:integrase